MHKEGDVDQLKRRAQIHKLAQTFAFRLNLRLDEHKQEISANDLYVAYFNGALMLLKCHHIDYENGIIIPTTPEIQVPITDGFLINGSRRMTDENSIK